MHPPTRTLHGRQIREGQEVVERIGADLPVIENVAACGGDLLDGTREVIGKPDPLHVRTPDAPPTSVQHALRTEDHRLKSRSIQVLDDPACPPQESPLVMPRDQEPDAGLARTDKPPLPGETRGKQSGELLLQRPVVPAVMG